MDLNALLSRALILATIAHDKQIDKGGQPYILHPLRVALKMDTIEGKIVGLLHDVLEDSDFAVDDLIDDGFPPEIIDAVIALTRKKEENYQQFILRCKENPLARQVKLADLEDNLDTTRLPEIGEKERQRIKKYEQAVLTLQA